MSSENCAPTSPKFRMTPDVLDHCANCPLNSSPHIYHRVTTEVRSREVDVMFVAEAPGDQENQQGRPVIGRTGQILRRVVKQLNQGGEVGVAYGNVVRCRPIEASGGPVHDRPPTDQEAACCRHNILADIQRIKPKYLVLCGKAAVASLALDPATKEPVKRDLSVTAVRGGDFIVRTPDGTEYPATATFHFAYVARNAVAGSVFREDIARAFLRARGTVPDYSKRGKPVTVLDTVDKVESFLKHLVRGLTPADIVALDYETESNGRIGNRLLTVGFAYGMNQGFSIPYRHPHSPWTVQEFNEVRKLLIKFFTTPRVSFSSLVAHNLKFEAAVTLDEFGVYLDAMRLEDTMLRAHAINENRKAALTRAFGLKPLSDEWLGFTGYRDPDIAKVVELVQKGRSADVDLPGLCEYNAMDCYVTVRLYRMQDSVAEQENYCSQLKRLGVLMHGPESVFAAQMERNGIRANSEQLKFLMTDASPILMRQRDIEKELYALPSVQAANHHLLEHNKKVENMVGVWGSKKREPWLFHINRQASKEALYIEYLNLETGQTAKGRPSIDKKFYERHKGIQEVDLLSEWTELDKLRGTYIEGIYKLIQQHPDMRDGRVRAQFNFHSTATSRTSSEQPNMQNIPKGKTTSAKAIKSLYMVDPGYLMVCADYSQAEVRWLAEISKDQKLLQAFMVAEQVRREYDRDPSPENARRLEFEGDFHYQTASQIFKKTVYEIAKHERNKAKCVHPKTLVFSDRLVQLRHLVHLGSVDSFTAVPDSIQVYAHDKQWVGVEAAYNGGKKSLIHIVSRRGLLTCSREHALKLADGRLKKAGNIKKGDVLSPVVVPILVQDHAFPLIPVDLGYGLPLLQYQTNLDMAYVAGLFLGDGTRTGDHTIAIVHGDVAKKDRLGCKYKTWQNIIVSACKKVGLTTVNCHPELVYLGGRHVKALFTALDLLENEYRNFAIPGWVLSAGRSACFSFLAGLFDTDGTVTEQHSLSVTTKDPIFAGHIITLLHHLGMRPSMEPSWNKTYNRWYYRIRLPVKDSFEFKSWLRQPGKASRLQPPKNNPGFRKKNKVLCVVDAGTGPCMDLSVRSSDHLYTTNGFVTHNSIVFGLIYGMSSFGLAARLSISQEEAKKYQEMFLNQFPQAREWLEWIEREGFREGFVTSPIGRRRHLVSNYLLESANDLYMPSRGDERSMSDLGKFKLYEDRVCRNAPIQSIASDTNLMACIHIQRYIQQNQRDWRLINIVHDSIMAEIPFHEVGQYIEVANGIMTNPDIFKDFGIRLNVPFRADFTVGLDWGHQFDLTVSESCELACKACGKKRPESRPPKNRRCEECGSTDVEIQLVNGPLSSVLSYLEHRYHAAAVPTPSTDLGTANQR